MEKVHGESPTVTSWLDPGREGPESAALERVPGRSLRRADKPAPPGGAALRVLIYGGAATFQCPGGGEVQLVKTAQYLRRQGIRAKLFNPWCDKLRDADCLHLFGTLREHLPLVAAARQAGTPTLLSTIAWYNLRASWYLAQSRAQRLGHAGRFLLRAAAPWIPNWRRRLYDEVDLLLPNSRAEAVQLGRHFRVSARKICVVPNGADLLGEDAEGPEAGDQRRADRRGRTTSRLLDSWTPRYSACSTPGRASPSDLFPAMVGVRDYVLCPGRVEPRKNQLALLKALVDCDRPIVILGDPVPEHRAYATACRRAAGCNVHFVAAVPRNGPLLASAYRSAACVVLPAWFETPGLAALEAALAEVPLVVTKEGSTREYFGRHARYVDPHRPATIAAAVRDALANRAVERNRCERLAARVARRYTWRHVAAACRDAYEKVVS